jgi:hypothetical protein
LDRDNDSLERGNETLDILAAALELPEDERARVAQLSESLSDLPDADASEAWAKEIPRRIE